MSAALQLPSLAAVGHAPRVWQIVAPPESANDTSTCAISEAQQQGPILGYAFYRKHTESMLRRYLYASILVGRTPSLLERPFARGWASTRRVHTFEDTVVFVLDMERCLASLSPLDRLLLSKLVLQEYTLEETSACYGVGIAAISRHLSRALDRLTKALVELHLLILP